MRPLARRIRRATAPALACAALAACNGGGTLVTTPADLGTRPPDLAPSYDRCGDGLRNGDETDTDCGGACAPCPSSFTVPIHAVIVSDDDGRRPCPIDGSEIASHVAEANKVWQGTGVQFTFDPEKELSRESSTLVNNVTGAGDPNWLDEIAAGDRIAAKHPDRLVVLFRFGPGDFATGGAFSWTDYNFVAGAGRVSTVCGHWNVGLLAHEMGHYFGLSHTFAQVFGTLAEAEAFLAQRGGDPAAFDGDGLADTAPDPMIALPEYQCSDVKMVALGGQVLSLPRDNIMSYYEPRTGLSSMQGERARWFVRTRQRHAMAMPDNHAAARPVELDPLAASPEGGVSTGPQDMAGFGRGWTGDRQLFAAFPAGGALTINVPVAKAGRTRVDLYATFAPDFGRFRVLWDGAPAGVLDAYGPGVYPTGKVTLGVFDLVAGGHRLRLEQVGQNPASRGTALGLDCLDLVPAP